MNIILLSWEWDEEASFSDKGGYIHTDEWNEEIYKRV